MWLSVNKCECSPNSRSHCEQSLKRKTDCCPYLSWELHRKDFSEVLTLLNVCSQTTKDQSIADPDYQCEKGFKCKGSFTPSESGIERKAFFDVCLFLLRWSFSLSPQLSLGLNGPSNSKSCVKKLQKLYRSIYVTWRFFTNVIIFRYLRSLIWRFALQKPSRFLLNVWHFVDLWNSKSLMGLLCVNFIWKGDKAEF